MCAQVYELNLQQFIVKEMNERGYRQYPHTAYDRKFCLLPAAVLEFVMATQPKEWEKYSKIKTTDAKEDFLKRLASEIKTRGTLDVLRHGINEIGCHFLLAYFPPVSGLNPELQRLYETNNYTVVEYLHYSQIDEKSLDLAIFINGIPIFTAEIKNPITGQNVQDAIAQYKRDRDPLEPFLTFRRCLAHFAIDPDLVFVTTQLQGNRTRFLPFNKGYQNGAGNPSKLPSEGGFSSDYLWREIWTPYSVLNLIQHFIHEFEEEDEKGKRTGKKSLVFPRYHQLESVRSMIVHAKQHGTGQRYLIQHSAGSGKSNSIAWLAHQLALLHDAQSKKIFDSVIVITDRKVLDRQIQRTIRQFEQTRGTVVGIDRNSDQLRQALEEGKQIIISTLQKYPFVADKIRELPGKSFAVIVDEAHSSQTGETTKDLKRALAVGSLEEAEKVDKELLTPQDELDKLLEAQIIHRGRQPNLSWFAFTATPKSKTLELFGIQRPDGKYEPFSLYSMRQAIEEGFILDVLSNYTTYKVYWNLRKEIEDDPRYDVGKANYLLRQYVDLHEHAIREKLEIIIDHFRTLVAARIGNKAKAMIVTRSRLHAIRYKLLLDELLREKKLDYKALVAFSDTITDQGIDYTEAGMNTIPESQTAETFKKPDYRFLVVAEKFQTGFDQPLLHSMYVDKILSGVNAVQTLSRLNRTHPEKEETMVLDFANEADNIKEAFEPYYDTTLLSEATDPNLLYNYKKQLDDFKLYDQDEQDYFVSLYLRPEIPIDQLYEALGPILARFNEIDLEEQEGFRGQLTDFIRLYAFLAQIIPFKDTSLEKLYIFGKVLRRRLPELERELPREIQQKINLESYRLQQTMHGQIKLKSQSTEIEPIGQKDHYGLPPEVLEPLSEIIKQLNTRFGTDFTEADRVFIQQLEMKLHGNPSLKNAIKINPPKNARLPFDITVEHELQSLVDSNFKFYKRITDNPEFAKYFLDWLFDRFRTDIMNGETK